MNEDITMNKFKWLAGSTMLGAILAFGTINMVVSADQAINKKSPKPNVTYQEECSECHMAYPANFLPEKSWNKILATLDDHFGENAELDNETNQALKSYLAQHAMKKNLFNRLLRNFPSDTPTPLRITELPYFIRKHDEIPQKWVKNNPKVGSFSQCDKCHQGAASGDFEEDNVRIPGVGRWD